MKKRSEIITTSLLAVLLAGTMPLAGCNSANNATQSETKTSTKSSKDKATSKSATKSSAKKSTPKKSAENNSSNTPPDKPGGNGGPGGNPPDGNGGGGPNTQTYDYTGTLSATLNVKSGTKKVGKKTISNSSTDQNVALAQKTGKLILNGTTLTKIGSSQNDDNSNFYGLNSILLVNGKKALVNVKNAKLTSSATGANGIFATNNGTAHVTNTSIKTTGDANSRGLDATYGGKIIANKVTISTKGDHSAAVATDRGGGKVSVTDSKLSTKGSGSPLVYSTGDIEYNNVTGTATGSQIAGMEGYNRISVYNSKLTSTNDKTTGSDPIKNGVIIYQSMSGDADTSVSNGADFQAKDSILKSSITGGSMFYVTNTTGRVVLQNTKLDFNSKKADLLHVVGNNSNNWGSQGQNGGHLTFTGNKQTLKGNITVDSISKLDFYLLNKSTYTGKTSLTSNSSSKTKNPLTINIDKNSKWVVTGNSTVSKLNLVKGGKIVDSKGRKVAIKVKGKTVQKGTSPYIITVKSSFSTKVTTDSNNKLTKNSIK